MKKFVLMGLFLLIALILIPSATIAQQAPVFQYAVKFICGKSEGKVVAPGAYWTAINVHNPTDTKIVFRKKFAIALPDEKAGPVSEFFESQLAPDEALEIDIQEIFARTKSEADFLKGFVVIESEVELDVVAVYTAAGATGQVETLHIERISRRRRAAGCPDLVVAGIKRPIWDAEEHRSVIYASIKNIGNAVAGPTQAMVEDLTLRPVTDERIAYCDTPALAPGAFVTVTFYLPDWRYNPFATLLVVIADHKNLLSECREDNNTKVFEDRG